MVQVSLLAPNGTELYSTVAAGANLPVNLPLEKPGKYSVVVTPFQSSTGGFYVKVNEELVTPAPKVTSNFNLLFFDPYGHFAGAVYGDALATKQPLLIASIPYGGLGQLVIARSNIPTAAHPADQIRYMTLFQPGYYYGAEALNYNSYLSPTTWGHCVAQGANGVAAYSAYRPFIPETTSSGPATIYLDVNGNRLTTPEVRQGPISGHGWCVYDLFRNLKPPGT